MNNVQLLPADVKAPLHVRNEFDSYCHRIWQNDEYYIYKTPLNTYELFKRKTRPVPDNPEQMREIYPVCNSCFGRWAESFNRLSAAFEYLNMEMPKELKK